MLTEYMSESRFKDLRKFAWAAMWKQAAADSGKWWQVRGAIEGFNGTRARLLTINGVVVYEESMSAWRPRTMKEGGSYLLRNAKAGALRHGIQEHGVRSNRRDVGVGDPGGCEAMHEKSRDPRGRHQKGTTACVLRLRREMAPTPAGYKRLFIGDSWFASFHTAVALGKPDELRRVAQGEGGEGAGPQNANQGGDHFIGIVKTAHGMFPKAYIEAALNGLPRGIKIVLEATLDGVALGAVGW